MNKHLDRAKLLGYLGPDEDYGNYKMGIPTVVVTRQQLREAIRAGQFDVEPQPIGNTEQFAEIRRVLESAADTIRQMRNDYPNEMWTHTEKDAWEQIADNEITHIQSTLYPRAEMTPQFTPDLLEIKERNAKEMQHVIGAFGDLAEETLAYQSIADVQTLLAEVERLQSANTSLQREAQLLDIALHTYKSCDRSAAELYVENSALLEGLQFYGAETTYDIMHLDEDGIPIVKDKGQRARTLLALYGGKGDTQ